MEVRHFTLFIMLLSKHFHFIWSLLKIMIVKRTYTNLKQLLCTHFFFLFVVLFYQKLIKKDVDIYSFYDESTTYTLASIFLAVGFTCQRASNKSISGMLTCNCFVPVDCKQSCYVFIVKAVEKGMNENG